MKLLFPKHNYNVLSPSSYAHISVRDFQDWSAYSAAGKYVDRSWEYINRSQAHEWMWKLGMRLRNSQKRKFINGIFGAVHVRSTGIIIVPRVFFYLGKYLGSLS
jgi:hypothetical protein